MRSPLPVLACALVVLGLAAVPGVASAVTATAPKPVTGTDFHPLAPTRVLDTRNGTGITAAEKVGPDQVVQIDLHNLVPDTADPDTSVVLNVTVTDVTASTFVTALPSFDGSAPSTSTLNLSPGQTRANLVTVGTTNGVVDFYNHSGTVDIIADLAGYHSDLSGAGEFTPIGPTRALDTRASAKLGRAATKQLSLATIVPATATAVTLNVTALDATQNTFVTVWPGRTRPGASNLNLGPGDITPNQVVVALGPGTTVDLYNNAGATDVIVDVAGYYTGATRSSFSDHITGRVLNTRNGTGTGRVGPLGQGGVLALDLSGMVPPATTAVELNLTGLDGTVQTYVTAWQGGAARPVASDLNLKAGQVAANLVTVPVSANGVIDLYNNAGTVDLIADVEGYFGPPVPACASGCVTGFGDDHSGSVGDRRFADFTTTPGPLYGLTDVTSVVSTDGSSAADYALRSDGTVWRWGNGVDVPRRMAGISGVTAISGAQDGAFALRSDGSVWSVDNDSAITGRTGTVPAPIPGLSGVTAISSGWYDLVALNSDGTVTVLGDNSHGQLGTGTTCTCLGGPATVPGLTGVTAISGGDLDAYALRSDGTVWSWGFGAGRLHAGDTTDQSLAPSPVNGLSDITAIAGGSAYYNHQHIELGTAQNGYALRSDGTVWAWGQNLEGELGNGTSDGDSDSLVPGQVTGLTDVTSITAATNGAYAFTADGTLWGWGNDNADQLDDGNSSFGTLQVDSPVRLPVTGAAAIFSGYQATWLLAK